MKNPSDTVFSAEEEHTDPSTFYTKDTRKQRLAHLSIKDKREFLRKRCSIAKEPKCKVETFTPTSSPKFNKLTPMKTPPMKQTISESGALKIRLIRQTSHGEHHSSEASSAQIKNSEMFFDSKQDADSILPYDSKKKELLHDQKLSTSSNIIFEESKVLPIPPPIPVTQDSIWEKYCKILPKSKSFMETKLSEFLIQYNFKNIKINDVDACEKFAIKQIIEIARSVYVNSLCLKHHFTSKYFFDLSEKVEGLLYEIIMKCGKETKIIQSMVQKFNLIISEPARILFCIENNPNKFENFTDQPECYTKLLNEDMDLTSYLKMALGEPQSDKIVPTNIISKATPQIIVQKNRRLPSISLKMFKGDNLSRFRLGAIASKKIQKAKPELWTPEEKDFNIIKLISQGAFGAVYLVRHITTKKRYALKKISKQHAMLKNQVRQIFAERDILSFTQNPFVVSMLCSFETKDHFCMVMEYVEGGDCASLLKAVGQFSEEMSRIYIAETLVAVEYIHNYGIIHRDIKPDNLLITAMGHIKLTDFGLSKVGLMNLATRNTYDYLESFHDANIQGTPDYIAPEVILNKPYGKMVDYWSLGIVLYEFLIGCTPFYGETTDQLFEAIVSATIEWPEKEEAISEDATDLICKLLNRDPCERLGANDAKEVKVHPYFSNIEWNFLLHTKAEFIPSLLNEEDTGYFDERRDRYDHESHSADNTVENSPFHEFSTEENENFTYSSLEFKKDVEETISSESNAKVYESTLITSHNVFSSSFEDDEKLKPIKTSNILESALSEADINEDKQYLTNFTSSISEISKGNRSTSKVRNKKRASLRHVFSTYKKSPPKKENEIKEINIRSSNFTKTIILEKKHPSQNFGFAIKTIRVKIQKKKLSFLQHIIESVRKDSLADQAEMKAGYVITNINDNPLDGMQHVNVIRLLSQFPNKVKISVASLESMKIRKDPKSFPLYYMEESSSYFKELLGRNIKFDFDCPESKNNDSQIATSGSLNTSHLIVKNSRSEKSILLSALKKNFSSQQTKKEASINDSLKNSKDIEIDDIPQSSFSNHSNILPIDERKNAKKGFTSSNKFKDVFKLGGSTRFLSDGSKPFDYDFETHMYTKLQDFTTSNIQRRNSNITSQKKMVNLPEESPFQYKPKISPKLEKILEMLRIQKDNT